MSLEEGLLDVQARCLEHLLKTLCKIKVEASTGCLNYQATGGVIAEETIGRLVPELYKQSAVKTLGMKY